MDFLQNLYVFVWALLAILLFFTGRKNSAFAYVLSLFFVFMTVWYGLDTFFGYNMFEGVMSIVFKSVLIVFLLVIVGAYVLLKRKNK